VTPEGDETAITLDAGEGDREPDGILQPAVVQPGYELVRAAGAAGKSKLAPLRRAPTGL
jgi:hypothetical protein